MKKVLIIDDESYFNEYLEHLISWDQFGFIVQSTSNPKEAMKILKNGRIDLVLSDIKMPEISGIELLHFVHNNQLMTNFIFISGYSDFKYAKEGIRYGAIDYLLKPIAKDELVLAIKRYQEKCNEEFQTNMPLERSFQFLLSSLNGRFQTEIPPYLKSIGEELFLIKTKNPSILSPYIKIDNNFFSILSSDNTKQKPRDASLSKAFFFYDLKELKKQLFFIFTQQNLSQEQWTILEKNYPKEFFQKKWNRLEPLWEKEYASDDILTFFFTFEFLILESTQEDFDLQKLKALFSLNQAHRYLDKFIKEHDVVSLTQQTIDTVDMYISTHLNENLSLEEIAKEVFLNPTYLSKLYKKQTGNNLSAFILEKRLEKAKDLLINSKLLISDIGDLVGFNSSQYFIRVFKEAYHVTPQQYRRMQYM